MTTSEHPRTQDNPAEGRSAFDEIVSDIVEPPLKKVRDDLQSLAEELRTADDKAMDELQRLRRTLGTPGPAVSLFRLLGDPEDPDEGTLASQLKRLQDDLQSLAEELRAADDKGMGELNRLNGIFGTPGHGAAATLFGLLGDPADPDQGTLARQLARIERDISGAEARLAGRHEALGSAHSDALEQLMTRQQEGSARTAQALASADDAIRHLSKSVASVTDSVRAQGDQGQQHTNAVSIRLNVLTILVIVQMVGLAALTLLR